MRAIRKSVHARVRDDHDSDGDASTSAALSSQPHQRLSTSFFAIHSPSSTSLMNASSRSSSSGTSGSSTTTSAADDGSDATTTDSADVAAAVPDFVLLFTVAVASNFISGLFPAQLAKTMQTTWAKHLVALLFIGLTIVWTEPGLDGSKAFFDTVLAYGWFLAMFHMTAAQFMTVVSILVVLFIVTRLRQQAEQRASARDATAADREHSLRMRRYEIGTVVLAALTTVAFTCLRLFRSHRSTGPEPLAEIPWWDTWELNFIRTHDLPTATASASGSDVAPPTLSGGRSAPRAKLASAVRDTTRQASSWRRPWGPSPQ